MWDVLKDSVPVMGEHQCEQLRGAALKVLVQKIHRKRLLSQQQMSTVPGAGASLRTAAGYQEPGTAQGTLDNHRIKKQQSQTYHLERGKLVKKGGKQAGKAGSSKRYWLLQLEGE